MSVTLSRVWQPAARRSLPACGDTRCRVEQCVEQLTLLAPASLVIRAIIPGSSSSRRGHVNALVYALLLES